MKQEKSKNPLYTELSGNFNEYYKELNILGEGTVGLVKKCRDLLTKKIYAVKIIKTRNLEIIENIKKEFKNLKKIVHKNIIEVKKLLIDNLTGKIYLVMEYFQGNEMFEYISQAGSYSEKKAKFLFKQLLEGIHFLHKKGIVHRDLKPNNILVSLDGNVLKITDFNVAKFCDDYQNYDDFKKNNYEMNTYTGTIAFRAPEMFEKLSYSESIDIWASGCVLFTMLSGEQPFYSQYIIDLIILIEKCEYGFENKGWDLISQEAKDLVRKLIVKDPTKRLAPKIALKDSWFEEGREGLGLERGAQIRSNLRKNKRRLTKTSGMVMDKRKSFNQGLGKGFGIFVKRMEEGEEEDDSCSDYNINDSYESFDSLDFENQKKGFGKNEIGKDLKKSVKKNINKTENNEYGDTYGFADLKNKNIKDDKRKKDSYKINIDFRDLRKNTKKNIIKKKKNNLDDIKFEDLRINNSNNILNLKNKKQNNVIIDKNNLKNSDKEEENKKKFTDKIKNEVQINKKKIDDFLNIQKKPIKIEDIEKILNE